MTDTQALRDLLVKVEAGADHITILEYAGNWAYAHGHAGLYVYVIDAYNGSLDAAKALHDAVLGDGNISTPGYMATVYMSGKASVWDIISGASHRGEVNAPSLHAISPARAWLIAILRALIAQAEQ